MCKMGSEDEPTPVVSKNRVAGSCGDGCGLRGPFWRVLAAELVGTAMLLLFTCLPNCTPAATSMHRALASGLVVAVIVQCFDHISGAQLNPTVTLASLIYGRERAARALVMMATQLAGAAAGVALLRLVLPAGAPRDICVTLPMEGLPVYKAALIEAALGGALALANCASWDPRNRYLLDSWPLRIGLTVAGLSLVAGEVTGASMNPVRSFGPALWSSNWKHHWVYWAGPLCGSAVSTAAYARVWRADRACAPRAAHTPPASPRTPRARPAAAAAAAVATSVADAADAADGHHTRILHSPA